MKNYSKLIALAFLAMGLKLSAQCTSCTTTISGADATNYTVLSGQTLCISPTGNASGNITVSSGGTLCNQGTVSSSNLWVAGGTFHNYGTINTNQMMVSNAGALYNHNTATIDSLLVTGSSSIFNNTGTLTGVRFTTAVNATTTNAGSITEDYVADTLATLNITSSGSLIVNFDFGTGYTSSVTNAGTINVTRDFGNAYTTNFVNNGNFTVGRDFYNSSSGTFVNNGYMLITRHFYNATSSVFTTTCMATVNGDWYNSASVFGANNPSCGGFNIAGMSLNSGTVGNSSTHIDLCDAGHPATNIDGNSGTIATTTTYCTCTNPCTLVGILEQVQQSNVLIKNLYPNPASDNVTLILNTPNGQDLVLEIKNMMGQIVYTKKYSSLSGESSFVLPVSSLAEGTYILSVSDEKNLQTKKMFNVIR